MTILSIAYSVGIGAIIGLVYGLSFLLQRRRVFVSTQTARKRFIFTFIVASTRILLLAGVFYHLLRLPSINFILMIIAFFATFWCTVFIR